MATLDQPKKELQIVTPKDLKFEVIEVRTLKNTTSENYLTKGIERMKKAQFPCALIFGTMPVKKPTGTARQDFDGTMGRKYTPTGLRVVCNKTLEILGLKISEEHIIKPVEGYDDIFVVAILPATARA